MRPLRLWVVQLRNANGVYSPLYPLLVRNFVLAKLPPRNYHPETTKLPPRNYAQIFLA